MKVNKFGSYEILCFLWSQIDKKSKRQFIYLFPLITLGSLAESISISAIVPFLIKLFVSENNASKIALPSFMNQVLMLSTNQILYMVIVIVILALLIRLLSIYKYGRWAAFVGSSIAVKAFAKFAKTDYMKYNNYSESETVNILESSTNQASSNIYLFVTLLISLMTSSGLILTGLILNPGLLTLIFITLGISYLIILKCSSNYIRRFGKQKHRFLEKCRKYNNDSYRSFKSIKLEAVEDSLISLYREVDIGRRLTGHLVKLFGIYPKILLESLAILLLTITVTISVNNLEGNSKTSIDFLMITVIFSRLLPLFQAIYSNISSIRASSYSILQLRDYMKLNTVQKNPTRYVVNSDLTNFSYLKATGISHQYANGKEILSNISLDASKGEWIGIKGRSGAGKSTLLDIIMGLVIPNKGNVFVNGIDIYATGSYINWRDSISHCSQQPFVIDIDIISNIISVFSNSKPDIRRLEEVWYCSLLDEFLSLRECLEIYKQPRQYLDEARLMPMSGGQKQRVSIAKTLYRKSDVLMLDECTSSLDLELEKKVLSRIKEIYFDKTVFMISHNTETFNYCDKVLELRKN